MKLRIVSDIHTDINQDRNYQFNFGDDFVVNCGDTAGDRFATASWIRSFMKRGVFVEGNHLGYNRVTYDSGDTKEESIKYLKNNFRSGAVRFLENTTYMVEDIVFVGCTLYTDFNLYGNPIYCLNLARKSMNDFKYVKVKDEDKIRRLSPHDTIKWHKDSVSFINKTCKKYPEKKIIVVTHYAPSVDCVCKEYEGDRLNAAFASNLDWVLQENENLILWCHGHMHSDVDFVKHGTRVVCCPLGYYNETKRDLKNYGLVIDTDEL